MTPEEAFSYFKFAAGSVCLVGIAAMVHTFCQETKSELALRQERDRNSNPASKGKVRAPSDRWPGLARGGTANRETTLGARTRLK